MTENLPVVRLPGCKSLSQRALLLAATADGRSELPGLSNCADSVHLRRALSALGARFEEEGDQWRVTGIGGPPTGDAELDVGEAGSSLRFLLPLCAAGQGRFRITGTPRLLERPHGPLLDALQALGARVRRLEDGSRPGFLVEAQGLPGGAWPAPAATSSQYLSGLVMAALWSGAVHFALPTAIPSRGYFDLTLDALRSFAGAEALTESPAGAGSRLQLTGARPQGTRFLVPGDPSAASFFLVGLVLRGGAARLEPDWSPRHPEAELLRFFLEEGLLERQGTRWFATGRQPAGALRLALDAAPDAGPALAVLGAHLPQGLILEGVARLRAKESDRLAGIFRLAKLAGSTASQDGDCVRIGGGGIDPQAATPEAGFDPDQDHRMAMAAGILSLRAPGVTVADPSCVAKSFPDFWSELQRFGAA